VKEGECVMMVRENISDVNSMAPHSIHTPSSTPHQVSEKAIKEVSAVVREQLGLPLTSCP
jgi:hypothetical protein